MFKKISCSLLALMVVLSACLVVPALSAEAAPESKSTAGPFWNPGTFAGSLMLNDGSAVFCYADGVGLTCYHYGEGIAELVYGVEIGADGKAIMLQGCKETAWAIIKQADSVVVLSFALPAPVAECSDGKNSMFYPLVFDNGGEGE